MTLHLHDSEACQFCCSGDYFRAPMPDYPDAHVPAVGAKWVTLCRRTDDPKLAWLEVALYNAGIPSRRSGASFHAPILLVPSDRLDAAWAVLGPVDEIADDDTMFNLVGV